MRKIVLLIVALALVLPATAAHAWNFFDRNPVEIEGLNLFDVQRLVEMEIDVDAVSGSTMRAYLTKEEFEIIRAQGYAVRWIPNEAKIMRDALWEATKDTKDPMVTYHTFAELTAELQAIAAANPTICHVESAGYSHQGRELWWMKISDNVDVEEDEPEFKYISSMHGDEVVGMEMCMYLINHLVDNYGTDTRITDLVDDTEIWIMPSMNPDGTAAGSRYNAQGYDLNRNFPDPVTDPDNTPAGHPTEVQVIMNWITGHTPIQSANFHGGALVVNYPWDHTYGLNPDNDVFIMISEAYSIHNSPMWNGSWYHGITHGASWYLIHGGMQDWNYVWHGCNEVTIEISNVKWPSASTLPGFWEDNREAMLSYMEQVHIGVRGLVTDAGTGSPIAAAVAVQGRDQTVYTDPHVGDYHRMLLPGSYTLEFEADGYVSAQVPVVVPSGDAAVYDVQMSPVGPNEAPYDPADPSPADSAVEQATSLDLGWTGGDPNESNVVTYSVYLDTVDPPVALEDSFSEVATVTDLELAVSGLAPSTTYYWQVAAEDNQGESVDGAVWSFTTSDQPNTAPNTPSSPLPPNGSTGQSITPTLRWNGGDDDAGDTVTYSIYLDTVNPPEALAGTVEEDATVTVVNYYPAQLANDATYYWKVVADDGVDISVEGPVWSFTTTSGGGTCFLGAAMQ